MKKWKLLILLLLLGVILFLQKEISYGWMQLKGQLSILYDAKPLETYQSDSSFADSLKVKLDILNQIKEYAADSFLLPVGNKYTTMYDQKGEDVLWVVTAAKPFELTNYEWWFPVLGSVSYKGFFNFQRASDEELKLKEQGYDTRIRPVGAWSTLGWFNDPLMSRMLERNEAELAEVIFHELIHDVVYIRDSTDFNENLASFMAEKITLSYLQDFGDSIQISTYLSAKNDKQKLNQFVINQLVELDKVYASIKNESISIKKKMKAEAFNRFKESLKTIQFNDSSFADFLLEKKALNNAHILAFERYGGFKQKLERQYQDRFNSDIILMLSYYKENFHSI